MDERKISKEVRQILLTLDDGQEIRGEVFLNLHDIHHAGPQRVGDLLNGTDQFIPVRTAEGTRLYHLRHLAAALVPAGGERDELMTLGERYAVHLTTLHRREVECELFVNLPPEACRVKDYLNQPLRFFRFFLPEHVLYLNRDYLLAVRD